MTKTTSQKQRHGPRKRVFAHLSRHVGLADTPGWTVNTDGTTSSLPPKDELLLKSLDAGYMQLFSFFEPGLPKNSSYTTTVTQRISITHGNNTRKEPPIQTLKKFFVEGPQWSVDPKVVDSVYPPPAHKDYPSILPCITFNDPHYPWMGDMKQLQQTESMKMPWLGLLVFTESEITPTPAQINDLQQKLPAQNPTSKSFSMKVSDLVSLDSLISQPIPQTGDAGTDSTLVDVVFVSNNVFDGIFGGSNNDSSHANSSQSSQPDLTRFMYMSHVKNVNVTNLQGEKKTTNDDVGQFSVTVCTRTGPLDLKDDTTLYVHLVSLENVAERITIPSGKTGALTALISLYSWSYACIPAEKVSVFDTLRNLGQTVQPMRIPDFYCDRLPEDTKPEKLIRQRMDAGYCLVNYRLRTGEQTMAFQRGPLSPTPLPHPMGSYPEQSNFGTDLIILDKELGMLDLTYQLAWQLGRVVAMADRVFVAALLRLRATIHEQALANAKEELDHSFKSRKTVLEDFGKVVQTIKDPSGKKQAGNNLERPPFSLRWRRSTPYGRSLRSGLTFKSKDVQTVYLHKIREITRQNALREGSTNLLYNEMNSPTSPDYAVILEWCLDRFFLHGIPYHYILPNSLFVPKESIRTFYVDENWLDVFLDGALSLGNYYARETDCIRTSIKKVLNEYLTTNLPNGHLPQIPRWGFILRSEIVVKFPDLVISAPWPDGDKEKVEVLKIEKLDDDMLLCLFDRVPEDGAFKGGITLLPPEHQMNFELGVKLTPDDLQMEWKRIYTGSDCQTKKDYTPPPKQTYTAKDQIFDFSSRCLIFPQFAQKAADALEAVSNNDVAPTPALTGVQLIADIPKLKLAGGNQAYRPSPPRQIYLGTKDCELSESSSARSDSAFKERREDTKESPATNSTVTHRVRRKSIEMHVRSQNYPAALGHNHHNMARASFPSSDSPSLNTVLPTETPSNDSASQLKCAFICGALECGKSIPVNIPSNKYPLLPPNYDGPAPKWSSQLPPLVDQGFSIVATTKEPGWCLEYVEISIPVGTCDSDLLAPFVTGHELAEKNAGGPGSVVSTSPSALSCAPTKPQISFGELGLPEVIPFSRARRFLPSVAYQPDRPDPSTANCGKLVIRMRPISRDVNDLTNSYDASFVIKQPSINWKQSQDYIIEVEEKYKSTPTGESNVSVQSQIVIHGCYAYQHADTGQVDITC